MREVKEKSPLKERAAETLKSTPQAAFRRGTDASFQQLRQELREAAQDGQPEDRYESSKITDTADHAVRQVSHLAEKAVHKLPKTKSESEARTESVPQHEQPRHPLQPTAAPREYPPVSAQPDYPPQSQPQVSRSARESASPIREKPFPPANAQQPKTRVYTPDAKAPASPSQYPTPRIHENATAVSAETMPSTMEHSVRESASSIKEKTIPPTNPPQPKMREYAPTADAPLQQFQHLAQIHEKPQTVSHSQVNQPVREFGSSVKEIPAVKARKDAPRTAERQPKVRKDYCPVQVAEKIPAQAKKQPLGQSPAITEPAVLATPPTTPPSARILPREKPPVSSLQEIPAALKPDTTQFALPEIKTKEYIRKKRKKQHLLKEEASDIENITADSETFSPVIRTRETVREQQKLHVSHSAEQEQPVMPQIRTRQPQIASMLANAESVKPDVPQPPLPDIKSKQKYIAAQQPTQVTPVQANPQQAVRQTGRKAVHGESKLCQPPIASETVTVPTSRNVTPVKPVRVQKRARLTFVKKRKIKTAPKAKIKTTTPAAKALPIKTSTAPPKQAATVIRKGRALRDTAIKAAKAAKEAGKKVLRAIAAAAEKLAAAIGAGGAAAVSIVVVILLVGMLFASPLGILFAGEDTGTEIKIPDAVATLNGEFTDEIYRIMEENPYDELDMQEGMEAAMLQNWRNVLAVYAVKVSTDEEHGLDVMTMDEEKLQLLREIFFDANKFEYELTTRTIDGERITTLHISVQIKDAMQMADEYGFTAQQREMLEELLKPDYDDIFLSLIGDYQPGGTPIGPVDISDIQGTLPDDLDPLRETIVLTAYQLLGKVTYFWGGKSLVLGWDSRWGTPTTVTAPRSGSTGKVLPFGLDCSGFVDWTFYNATSGAYLPGRGGGAASQHGYCTNIAWTDALPGDLVFYADDSHVGIVCGYDSMGNILVIHCSGGQNGVVVTGREGFAVAARPDLFTD